MLYGASRRTENSRTGFLTVGGRAEVLLGGQSGTLTACAAQLLLHADDQK
jgi:hypothetical protein